MVLPIITVLLPSSLNVLDVHALTVSAMPYLRTLSTVVPTAAKDY